jgi:hypothetical protein
VTTYDAGLRNISSTGTAARRPTLVLSACIRQHGHVVQHWSFTDRIELLATELAAFDVLCTNDAESRRDYHSGEATNGGRDVSARDDDNVHWRFGRSAGAHDLRRVEQAPAGLERRGEQPANAGAR